MADYRNKFRTILEDSNDVRIPLQDYLTSAQLNGKKTKEYMVLREVVGGKDVGPEIKIQPETIISGL